MAGTRDRVSFELSLVKRTAFVRAAIEHRIDKVFGDDASKQPGGGDDHVVGQGGPDLVEGDEGNDVVKGGSGNDEANMAG